MEIVVAAFIGLWLTIAGVLAYRQMKKDFYNKINKNGKFL